MTLILEAEATEEELLVRTSLEQLNAMVHEQKDTIIKLQKKHKDTIIKLQGRHLMDLKRKDAQHRAIIKNLIKDVRVANSRNFSLIRHSD
jgi:hypothetical protein